MSNIRTHYDNLKVSRNAPPEVIRAAYKALTQKYHPDKNPHDAGAARIMHIINSSYEALSDPQRRAAHDLWIADMEREAEEKRERRRRKNTHSSEPDLESKLAAEQKERARLERLLTLERQRSAEFYATHPAADFSRARATNRWLKITIGLCAPILVVGILLILAYKAGKVDAGFRKLSRGLPRLAASLSCPRPTPPAKDMTTAKASGYVRAKMGPNGLPWPRQAEYLAGSKVLRENGLSYANIDNTRNGSDVLAKLVEVKRLGKGLAPAIETEDLPQWQSPEEARVFFIPAYGSFTLKKIEPGTYEIHYQDLDQGVEWKSDTILVTQEPSTYLVAPDVGYSQINMVLYRGPAESCKTSPMHSGNIARNGTPAAKKPENQGGEARPLWHLFNKVFLGQSEPK